MSTSILSFNGVNGTTGKYLLPPIPPEVISAYARGVPLYPKHAAELKWWHQRWTQQHLAPKEGVDPKNLEEAGWGVIFAHGADPAIHEALKELLELRRAQASRKKGHYYREFTGVDAYRPAGPHGSAETKSEFLARHGAGSGPADPENVPYYLLIVGDPETIPYEFQYHLDVQYAVGRIHFDRPEEYARYARSVVEAESGKLALPRRAAFFGTCNPDDPATRLSVELLVGPLAEAFRQDQRTWQVETALAEQATKSRLGELLGGAQTPALLFTASHGMGFEMADPRLLAHQGALLCQDWPGPVEWREAVPHEHYFSFEDVGDDARLLGLIGFHFACYGAGTPRLDEFPDEGRTARKQIAPHAFLARLPQRLMGHPRGGALAVVGHVERAWGCSFLFSEGASSGKQIECFSSSLKRLTEGHPIGSAFEWFNERYAELATELSTELREIQFGKIPDDLKLSAMWTATHDARAYVILGDPAVRLPVAIDDAGVKERGSIAAVAPRPATAEGAAAAAAAVAGGTPAVVIATPPSEGGRLPESEATPSPAALSWFGGRRDREDAPGAGIADEVQEMTARLVEWLKAAIEDATTLDVTTYVSDDMAAVRLDGDQVVGARLRALTRIDEDGDVQVCVPEDGGEVDTELWAIHSEMVARAQAHRMEMMKTAGAVAAQIFRALKP